MGPITQEPATYRPILACYCIVWPLLHTSGVLLGVEAYVLAPGYLF